MRLTRMGLHAERKQEFGPALELLKKAGFASVVVWENGRFVDKLLPKV